MKDILRMRILATISLLSFSSIICSQVPNENNANQVEKVPAKELISIPFMASPNALAKSTDKNQIEWFNLMEVEHLIFKRSNKGRKFRGNAILFHSMGENPRHNRLINPLSIQLSNLGWNTFSPNIGFSDFPRKPKPDSAKQAAQSTQEENLKQNEVQNDTTPPNETNPSAEPDTLAVAEILTNYFKTHQSYQEYFTAVCQETLKLITDNNQPTIIIANGEAAFWVLECVAQMPVKTPIILIEPTAPLFAHDNLDSKLQTLTHPLFTFATNDAEKDHFVKLIKNRKWSTSMQRYDESTLLSSKLNIENITLAKIITGWVKTIVPLLG